MTWATLTGAEQVFLLRGDFTNVQNVEFKSFSSRDRVETHDTSGTVHTVTVPGATLTANLQTATSPHWVPFTKDQLNALDPATNGWILIKVDYGDAAGAHWCIARWQDGPGFSLELRGVELRNYTELPGSAAAPGFIALSDGSAAGDVTINSDADIEEWVFCAGVAMTPNYCSQSKVVTLVHEFNEIMQWDGTNWPETNTVADPQTTHYRHQLMVTILDNNSNPTPNRTGWMRMFPPGTVGPVAAATLTGGHVGATHLAGDEPWVQWYPVYKVDRAADPVGASWGVEWGYAYLRWISTNAPGRVGCYAIVSHAICRGPTQVCPAGSGRQGHASDFGNAARAPNSMAAAFAPNAVYWITGCNSNTSIVAHGASTMPRQQIASVEGHFRARMRLRNALDNIEAQLNAMVTAGSSANPAWGAAQTAANAVINALFTVTGGDEAWQLPEAGEIMHGWNSNATYSEREADAIRNLAGFGTQRTALQTFAGNAAPTLTDVNDAIAAAQALRGLTDWASFQNLLIHGTSVNDWITRANTLLASNVHYASAAGHYFQQNGRADVEVRGGNPGFDGQHLDCRITVTSGGTEVHLAQGMLTAYVRDPTYSRSNRHWLVAFWNRFGLVVCDDFGYFRYDNRHNAGGAFTGRTGPGTQNGCLVDVLEAPDA